MRRHIRALAGAMALLGLISGVIAAPAAADEQVWVVDDDRAQCADADFSSIEQAVKSPHVRDDDVVIVCPGLYPDSVVVDKTLTIQGDTDAVDAIDCFSTSLSVDPAVHAIIDPLDRTPTKRSFGLKLREDRIVVEGLVFRDGYLGIDASDDNSGYQIRHNFFRSFAYFGVELGSNGKFPTRANHNCFSHNAAGFKPDGTNEGGGGIGVELDDPFLDITDPLNRTAANARDLTNARIDHNETYRNHEALAAFGPGLHDQVVFDHNLQRDDRFGILIQNSVSSAILDNDLAGPAIWPPRPPATILPIFIGGANDNLEIARNVVSGGNASLTFSLTAGLDVFFEPSRDLVVRGNTFVGAARSGIGTAPLTQGVPAIVDSLFEGNTTSGNGFNGIILQSGNTGNAFVDNVADGNGGSGIFVRPGAGGNSFINNSMHGNGWSTALLPPLLTEPKVDARDDSWPLNTWTNTSCVTDSPVDAICVDP